MEENIRIEVSVFDSLNNLDVSKNVKSKNGLKYISWASAWAGVKKIYPDATYKVYPQIMDSYGNERFWHDDGKTGWVTVGVTINGLEAIESLAIMDFRNQSIPADKITSVDANKSKQRCLAKACALHGLGLYIYQGEDIPEETARVGELQEKIKNLVDKKCKLSEAAKNRVGDLCKNAEREANPDMDSESITGNYTNINDVDVLERLEKQLLAIRK